jgi:hypothetical protein
LAPLLNFPVLFFLVLLPLTLLAAFGLRQLQLKTGLASGPVLLGATGLLLAAAVAGLLLFAVLYLDTSTFTDHIEPNTAVVSWLYAQGGQIYHEIDAATRYAFLYGPLAYLATALSYTLLGGSTLAAKLPGFLSLLTALVFIALAVRKRMRDNWYAYFVALGYFAVIALFFKNHSFWSKPDSYMIAAAAIGMYSCLMWPGRNAWLVCGIALGAAVSAKVTGAVYFLPFVAWFFDRDGYRAALVILLAAAVTALLPFIDPQQVSLVNYLDWLRSSGEHGLSKLLLVQNLVFLMFMLLPLACFGLWQIGSVGARSWAVTHKLLVAASVAAGVLIWIAASKPGSGPHHFLPFLPALAFLTALAAARVRAYRPITNWSLYAFWAPAAAFLGAATVKAGFALFYGLQVVIAQAGAVAIEQDIAAIIAAYPGKNIQMGYGDGTLYPRTFRRHQLVYAGNPYLIDAPSIMDAQYSGIDIPQQTIARLLADDTALWLIPAGAQPFTIGNWYYRYTGELLFDEAFRSAFSDNFHKLTATEYFDIYVPVD